MDLLPLCDKVSFSKLEYRRVIRRLDSKVEKITDCVHKFMLCRSVLAPCKDLFFNSKRRIDLNLFDPFFLYIPCWCIITLNITLVLNFRVDSSGIEIKQNVYVFSCDNEGKFQDNRDRVAL